MHSLHAALKDLYTRPGDRQEGLVEGYQVDVVRPEMLVEIQTRNFANLKEKLNHLLINHPVRVVYPIARDRWLVRLPQPGVAPVLRRKSTRRGRWEDIFWELVHLPASLVTHPHFSLELLLVQDEEIRLSDNQGSWRRRGESIKDRRLISILDRLLLEKSDDYYSFFPPALPEVFTARQLSLELNLSPRLASKMLYSLRSLNIVDLSGKQNRAYLYSLVDHHFLPAENP